MTRLVTKVTNGRIELQAPPNWPNGTEVFVEPVAVHKPFDYQNSDDWPTDPESIAAWIAEAESIPPMEMTREEEAAWLTTRQCEKEAELSRWEEHGSKLDKLFP